MASTIEERAPDLAAHGLDTDVRSRLRPANLPPPVGRHRREAEPRLGSHRTAIGSPSSVQVISSSSRGWSRRRSAPLARSASAMSVDARRSRPRPRPERHQQRVAAPQRDDARLDRGFGLAAWTSRRRTAWSWPMAPPPRTAHSRAQEPSPPGAIVRARTRPATVAASVTTPRTIRSTPRRDIGFMIAERSAQQTLLSSGFRRAARGPHPPSWWLAPPVPAVCRGPR